MPHCEVVRGVSLQVRKQQIYRVLKILIVFPHLHTAQHIQQTAEILLLRQTLIMQVSNQRRQQQGDRPERSERRERPRRDEDAYDLPPVEQSTTSLAGLFAAAMANAEKKDEE